MALGLILVTKPVHPKLPTTQIITCQTQKPAASRSHHQINGTYSTITRLKTDINKTLQGINRGIFGIQSEKKSEIEEMVKLLESVNPNPHSTLDLNKLGGCWKLIYSTISILGSKRTKLGLRDFISLGDFLQLIDVDKGKAVNVIMFNVRGLNMFSGKLVIEASFKRVDISYNTSTIIPEQLKNMFLKNYDILLGIFNPDGWLEITYVDETLRIGRDDKGNIFVLERSKETNFGCCETYTQLLAKTYHLGPFFISVSVHSLHIRHNTRPPLRIMKLKHVILMYLKHGVGIFENLIIEYEFELWLSFSTSFKK